jgi:hypothetical protein
MWKTHVKFNGWKVKENNDENNEFENKKYKRVNIEELSFL